MILRDFATEAGTKAVQIGWDYDDGPLQKVRLEIISDEGLLNFLSHFIIKKFQLNISIF